MNLAVLGNHYVSDYESLENSCKVTYTDEKSLELNLVYGATNKIFTFIPETSKIVYANKFVFIRLKFNIRVGCFMRKLDIC